MMLRHDDNELFDTVCTPQNMTFWFALLFLLFELAFFCPNDGFIKPPNL